MVKAITLGRESYHFTLRKLSFLTVKAMLLRHKKVRHGSQNESKRTFFAFILFFQKSPPWKSRFTATLSHSTPPMGSCSTTAEKCAQNEFSVFRTFRTFSSCVSPCDFPARLVHSWLHPVGFRSYAFPARDRPWQPRTNGSRRRGLLLWRNDKLA